MKRCSEIDALVTPFVDGEVGEAQKQDVAQHLDACPPCLRQAVAERTAREAVRGHAAGLLSPAPPALRSRCLASAGRRPRVWSAARVPLAMAATLLLAIGGALVYSTWVNPTVAMAAQLTLDHLKCFMLFDQPAGLEPAEVRAALRQRFGWDIDVPEANQVDGLSLVGGRHCVYLDGSVAHLLYKKGRVPVSVFVLPAGESLPAQALEVMGHSAVGFERGGRTWVVLAREAPDEVKAIAGYFAAERR